MNIIKKTFSFDAAHRLSAHPGRCANIHGHTYHLTVGMAAKGLRDGMVMDFGEVARLVNAWLEGPDGWDHALLLDVADPLLEQLRRPCKGMRLVAFAGPPTAENMADYAFDAMKAMLPEGIVPVSVEVWETPTACAVVER